MWPPPLVQCHEKANGFPLQLIWSVNWLHVSAVLVVRVAVNLYLSNSGQPPLTHASGTGALQQSLRPNSLSASVHCRRSWPREVINISPLASHHHLAESL